MNSVRHCLSTMVVFRKVPRIRNEGKSLWAIYEEDVQAFANGTFKKSLCADMVKIEKEKQAKRGPRKRAAAGDGSRDTKRLRGEPSGSDEGARAIAPHPMLPPYFPPFHANPHHQPYYQTYVPQAIPAEVVFPPLPPNMGLARSSSRAMSARPESAAGSSAPRPDSAAGSAVTEVSLPRGRDRSPKHLSSSSSVPALTPNCSSSSSPPLSSHASLVDDGLYNSSPAASPAVVAVAESDDDSDMEVSWLQSGPPIEALAPSALLLKPADFTSSSRSKTKQRDAHKRYQVRVLFPRCVRLSNIPCDRLCPLGQHLSHLHSGMVICWVGRRQRPRGSQALRLRRAYSCSHCRPRLPIGPARLRASSVSPVAASSSRQP